MDPSERWIWGSMIVALLGLLVWVFKKFVQGDFVSRATADRWLELERQRTNDKAAETAEWKAAQQTGAKTNAELIAQNSELTELSRNSAYLLDNLASGMQMREYQPKPGGRRER